MGDHESRGGHDGEGREDVEVKDEIGDVEIPRLGTVQSWPTSRVRVENVVLEDIPWRHGEFAICYAVDRNNGNLGLGVRMPFKHRAQHLLTRIKEATKPL